MTIPALSEHVCRAGVPTFVPTQIASHCVLCVYCARHAIEIKRPGSLGLQRSSAAGLLNRSTGGGCITACSMISAEVANFVAAPEWCQRGGWIIGPARPPDRRRVDVRSETLAFIKAHCPSAPACSIWRQAVLPDGVSSVVVPSGFSYARSPMARLSAVLEFDSNDSHRVIRCRGNRFQISGKQALF